MNLFRPLIPHTRAPPPSEVFYWVPYHALAFAPFWLLTFLMGSMTSLVDAILEALRKEVAPRYSDAVREVEHNPKSSGLPCDGKSQPEPELPEGEGGAPSLNPIRTSQQNIVGEQPGSGEVRFEPDLRLGGEV